MKIFFINSLNIRPHKLSLEDRNKSFLEKALPIGLLNLSGAINKSKGIKPVIIDLNEEASGLNFPSPTFFEELYTIIYNKVIEHLNGEELIIFGFQSLCNSHHIALFFSDKVKKDFKNSIIIMGGPHASITAHQTLDLNSSIDYVLAGEADFAIIKFIDAISRDIGLSDVPGLFYRNKNGEVISPKKFDIHNDLDLLPFPEYSSYPYTPSGLYIEIGRGCPFTCTYCSTSTFFSRKPRYKSIKRISDEINHALSITHEHNTVNFIHDHFLATKKYALPLLKELEILSKEKMLNWTCSARPDSITNNLAAKLKKSSFTSIYLGIESGSDDIQKKIRKNLKIKDTLKAVQNLRDQNIETTCSFIQGFPGETKLDLEKTLVAMAICSLYGAIIQLHPLTWMPGTELFEKYKESLIYFPERENTQYHPKTVLNCSQAPLAREIFSVFYKLGKHLPEIDDISKIALTAIQDYPMSLLLTVEPWRENNLIVETIIKWKSIIGNKKMDGANLTLWIGQELENNDDILPIYKEVVEYERKKVNAYLALNKKEDEGAIHLDNLTDIVSSNNWRNMLTCLSNRCVLGSIFTNPMVIAKSLINALDTKELTLDCSENNRHDYILKVTRNKHQSIDSLIHINMSDNIKLIIQYSTKIITLGNLFTKTKERLSDVDFWFLIAQLINHKLLNIMSIEKK